MIPLFPELRKHLEAAWDRAEPGTKYVITRRRNKNANLRTQLLRIVKRAGIEPWPKLFHNLRASRQTELAAEFPSHVVCAWLGNSEQIARKHYLTVRDADFEKAAGRAAESGAVDAENGAEALHFPVQQPAARLGTESQETKKAPGNEASVRAYAIGCGALPMAAVPPRGVPYMVVSACSIDTCMTSQKLAM